MKETTQTTSAFVLWQEQSCRPGRGERARATSKALARERLEGRDIWGGEVV
jgi:hypothetical protein